jgi:hypothetical protein
VAFNPFKTGIKKRRERRIRSRRKENSKSHYTYLKGNIGITVVGFQFMPARPSGKRRLEAR